MLRFCLVFIYFLILFYTYFIERILSHMNELRPKLFDVMKSYTKNS